MFRNYRYGKNKARNPREPANVRFPVSRERWIIHRIRLFIAYQNTDKKREQIQMFCIDGAPKITECLKREGEVIAEKTVGNYMREMGIKAQYVKPYTVTTINSDFSNKLKNCN